MSGRAPCATGNTAHALASNIHRPCTGKQHSLPMHWQATVFLSPQVARNYSVHAPGGVPRGAGPLAGQAPRERRRGGVLPLRAVEEGGGVRAARRG